MRELSLHILDIVQNSIRADASMIIIDIEADFVKDYLTIRITDNGKGMDKETLKKVTDAYHHPQDQKGGHGIPFQDGGGEQRRRI